MVQNSYYLSENSWAPEFIAASAKKLTSPKRVQRVRQAVPLRDDTVR